MSEFTEEVKELRLMTGPCEYCHIMLDGKRICGTCDDGRAPLFPALDGLLGVAGLRQGQWAIAGMLIEQCELAVMPTASTVGWKVDHPRIPQSVMNEDLPTAIVLAAEQWAKYKITEARLR